MLFSSGWRKTSRLWRWHSGRSSTNRMPWCARDTSAGMGSWSPPFKPTSEMVWWGVQHGLAVTNTMPRRWCSVARNLWWARFFMASRRRGWRRSGGCAIAAIWRMGFLTRGSKILFKTSICSGDGQIDVSNLQAAAQRQQVTDVALANYTRPDPAHTVLMLSRGMPYDGVRADLYAAGAYGRCCTLFSQQIHETILPLLQLRRENSVDLHIARWEPPLPVAAPG